MPKCTLNYELDSFPRNEFSNRLVDWYLRNRRPMNWHGANAYSVWVSETMLQQTQAATVTDFYNRFMASFPTVECLATASEDSVLAHWSGLGYYARARNLHLAAKMVVAQYGGTIPNTIDELVKLPGIGRYTAGAILSIAFHQPVPLVDANVARVFSRMFMLDEPPNSARGTNVLWAIASLLVPMYQPGLFNQGLMELGATVCTPAEPACGRCPAAGYCKAFETADPTRWPLKPARKKVVQETHCSVVVHHSRGGVYLVKRPSRGLWGGLWEFPRVVCNGEETPCDAAERAAKQILGLNVIDVRLFAVVKHSVTRYSITLHGCTARAHQDPRESEGIHLVSVEDLKDYPLAAPQVQLRDAIIHSGKRNFELALNL